VADPRITPKRQGRGSAGNSVEEKTLKTRQKGMNMLEERPVCCRLAIPEASPGSGKPWTKGGSHRTEEPT
jgi:hypothetical protein